MVSHRDFQFSRAITTRFYVVRLDHIPMQVVHIKGYEVHPLGGSGGMPPMKIWEFGPSEIISEALL